MFHLDVLLLFSVILLNCFCLLKFDCWKSWRFLECYFIPSFLVYDYTLLFSRSWPRSSTEGKKVSWKVSKLKVNMMISLEK